MEKKVVVQHKKGQKHVGKTDWSKIIHDQDKFIEDSDNPELVGKKQFKKLT